MKYFNLPSLEIFNLEQILNFMNESLTRGKRHLAGRHNLESNYEDKFQKLQAVTEPSKSLPVWLNDKNE